MTYFSTTLSLLVADPRDLLDVRVNALEVYATTAALSPSSLDKLSAFLDQVRKTLLLFGRAAEKVSSTPVQISEGVRAGFERIVRALERKGLLSEEVKATPRWRELCDVVLHIARRVCFPNFLPFGGFWGLTFASGAGG